MSQQLDQAIAFEKKAHQRRPSFVVELWQFIKYNKKWWLLPIIIVLLVLGILVIAAGSGLAPFIYTLF